jgi:POT family proton-dependent oligopeptide transporter
LCLVMTMAIGMIMGRRSFIDVPPSKKSWNSRYFILLSSALRERRKRNASICSHPEGGIHWLDWALANRTEFGSEDENLLKEMKMLYNAFVVFAFFPFYWFAMLQLGKMLVLQASMMQIPQGVTPDQIAAAEPILLLLFLPFADKILFPGMRSRGFRLNAITRIKIGFGFGAIAVFTALTLQVYVQASGQFKTCGIPPASFVEFVFFVANGGINVFVQIVVYFFSAVSQGFASVASLEFAMENAPPTLKSSLAGWSLFQVAIGALLGLAVSPVSSEINFLWILTGMGIMIVFLTIAFHVTCKDYK